MNLSIFKCTYPNIEDDYVIEKRVSPCGRFDVYNFGVLIVIDESDPYLGIPRPSDKDRIIYETFIGPIPEGYVTYHVDQNPHNHRIENIGIVKNFTAEYNAIKKYRKKFIDNSVREMVEKYRNGLPVHYKDYFKFLGLPNVYIENFEKYIAKRNI